MTRALAALLTRAIDYAGVFPPARLELASAVNHYIRYQGGDGAWIMGRLVVPTRQLPALAGLLKQGHVGPETQIAAIGTGGADRSEWEAGLAEDARCLNDFEDAMEGKVTVGAYETRLPDNAHAEDWVKDLSGFQDAEIYAELRWDDDLLDAVAALAVQDAVRLKIRTGGDTSAAFPSSHDLAEFLQGVTQLGAEFKLTAGLHHAFPTVDPPTGARMHGFVNVFAATACALVHDLSVREISDLLDCDDPKAFAFSDQGLDALNWKLDLGQLTQARECLHGFGSCSIDEPIETLRAAGLVTA